jgi:phosphoribosylanthranilate isomerase
VRGFPLVKICGVTRVEDAVLAVELGAAMIGLNFYPGSPRCVESDRARAIAAAVAGRALRVGVFVDASLDVVRRSMEEVGLDLAQLHGDEPDELVRALGARAVKAFRGGGAAVDCGRFPEAWGFLVDSGDRLRYGGTGESWTWRRLPRPPGGRPVLVAGGIGPANARAALVATGAAGIDVASGVESSPGVKDAALLRRLFEEVGHGELEVGT